MERLIKNLSDQNQKISFFIKLNNLMIEHHCKRIYVNENGKIEFDFDNLFNFDELKFEHCFILKNLCGQWFIKFKTYNDALLYLFKECKNEMDKNLKEVYGKEFLYIKEVTMLQNKIIEVHKSVRFAYNESVKRYDYAIESYDENEPFD